MKVLPPFLFSVLSFLRLTIFILGPLFDLLSRCQSSNFLFPRDNIIVSKKLGPFIYFARGNWFCILGFAFLISGS